MELRLGFVDLLTTVGPERMAPEEHAEVPGEKRMTKKWRWPEISRELFGWFKRLSCSPRGRAIDLACVSAGCDGEAVGRPPTGLRCWAESRKSTRGIALPGDLVGQGSCWTVGWNRLRDVCFTGRVCARSFGRGCRYRCCKRRAADDLERSGGPGASGREKREAGGDADASAC